MKICKVCGEKHIKKFYDGVASICIVCQNAKSKRQRLERKVKHIEWMEDLAKSNYILGIPLFKKIKRLRKTMAV